MKKHAVISFKDLADLMAKLNEREDAPRVVKIDDAKNECLVEISAPDNSASESRDIVEVTRSKPDGRTSNEKFENGQIVEEKFTKNGEEITREAFHEELKPKAPALAENVKAEPEAFPRVSERKENDELVRETINENLTREILRGAVAMHFDASGQQIDADAYAALNAPSV